MFLCSLGINSLINSHNALTDIPTTIAVIIASITISLNMEENTLSLWLKSFQQLIPKDVQETIPLLQ